MAKKKKRKKNKNKKRTYSIGDMFLDKIYGTRFVLARIKGMKVAMVCIEDGDSFTWPVKVKNVRSIPYKKFRVLAIGTPYDFKRFKKGSEVAFEIED